MPEDQSGPAEQRPKKAVGYSRTERGREHPLENLGPRARFSIWYYLSLLLGFFMLQSLLFSGADVREISYSKFRDDVRTGKVERVVITQDRIHGRLKSPGEGKNRPTSTSAPLDVPVKRTPWHLGQISEAIRGISENLRSEEKAAKAEQALHFTVVPLKDPGLLDRLQKQGVEYRGRIESHWLQNAFLNWVVPFALLFVVWGFLMRKMGKGPGILNVGQSKAKIYEVDPESRARFSDLAGVDEAIEDTREIVSFLHDPKKYHGIGAKLPKSALMVGYLTPGSDPIQKISIISRGQGALGYTLQMPIEDRYLMSRNELLDRVRVLLGGRASEEVVFDEISTGASDDIEKASEIVREMLTTYGMSEHAPNLSLVSHQNAGYLGQPFQRADHSDDLDRALDGETIKILASCYGEAKGALEAERVLLDKLARQLLKQEQLDQSEVEALLCPKPDAPTWAHGPDVS